MQDVLNLFENEVDQFGVTQRSLQIDNEFQRLTNYRKFGNKRDVRLLQVVNGYNKIRDLLDCFNVNPQ